MVFSMDLSTRIFTDPNNSKRMEIVKNLAIIPNQEVFVGGAIVLSVLNQLSSLYQVNLLIY